MCKLKNFTIKGVCMFYQNELSFLCDILKKSRINVHTVALADLDKSISDGYLDELFADGDRFRGKLPDFAPQTLYRFRDKFERNYLFMQLVDSDEPTVLCVGPYLASALSEQRILEIGELNGISPQKQRYVSEYYMALPIVEDSSPIVTVITSFCERVWGTPAFAITDVTNRPSAPYEPMSRSMVNDGTADSLINLKAMEMRYSFENELMRAVSLGQPHMEDRLREAFSPEMFEKRAADPLRNAKNYGVIMNTLLRKAAENGGVHPLYLDRKSSEFAHKIEAMSSLSENAKLMCEIFRGYCRLVRKHSLGSLAPLVQKTITTIDADLSADISPSSLAKAQGVSLGYLSTLFKKETGKTLSEYICERRMEYAAYLLRTTSLQIQTIALHCGILDVQYFSKIFKKYLNLTPSQYRTENK